MQKSIVLKRWLSVCFLFCNFSNLVAQQYVPLNEHKYLDSLNNIIVSKKSDSLSAKANFLLSDYWRLKDSVKSKRYLLTGKKQSEKYKFLQAAFYFYQGGYLVANDKISAEQAYGKACAELAKYSTKDAKQLLAYSWFNYALVKRAENGYEYLIDIILKKVIPISESINDTERTAYYYTQLGCAFMYNAQFNKAELLFNKSIALAEKTYPNSSTILLAYLSAAGNYCYLIKTSQARKMLNRAAEILKPYPESIQYPLYYYSESMYYTSKQIPNRILENADKGMVLAKAYNQKMLYQMLSFRKHEVYINAKQYGKSKNILLDLLSYGPLRSDVNSRKSIYGQLAKTNANMGLMDEAYKWLVAYNKINDSLNDAKLKEKINALEIKFRNVENQKKIEQLQIEKEKASLSAKNNRLTIWLLAAVAAFLLLITFFTINYYKNKNKLITSNAMLDGEEKERRRVARDLHDGLGGMLSAVKIKLSTWAANKNEIIADPELEKIIAQLDGSVKELRHIARNMMPESLLKFGLETALKDLCESANTENTSVDFHLYNLSTELPSKIQFTIYRIIQELLSNAVRHAEAKQIMVQCSQNGDTIFITVEDDGKGFDIDLIKQKQGMGMTNIKHRVNYLKGKLELQSEQNQKGTTVNIELNVT
ncbi:sensor histidine kinase [Pedobacter jejuensis]|uniref:histidine kinase n=1 Tax=Pedobacter jejuensis TaxID=1268550 RepID=A0A3N0C2T9_9SPHI|nr:sensor histidine kinase [Pedobacter jejuensis]RNL56495.1 sensor histidine kinase [Pedobacter jejuensis]